MGQAPPADAMMTQRNRRERIIASLLAAEALSSGDTAVTGFGSTVAFSNEYQLSLFIETWTGIESGA